MMEIAPCIKKLEDAEEYEFETSWGKIFFLQTSLLSDDNNYIKNNILTESENNKVKRLFRNKTRQNQIISGRFYMKWMIYDIQRNRYNNMIDSLRNINILNQNGERSGKPYFTIDGVRSCDDISISYSGENIILAYGYECRIGVDVEGIINNKDYDYLHTIFTDRECEDIHHNITNMKIEEKITLKWCIKEAVLKAAGVGFTVGYKSIEVIFTDSADKIVIYINGSYIESERKIYLLYNISEKYCKAACVIR